MLRRRAGTVEEEEKRPERASWRLAPASASLPGHLVRACVLLPWRPWLLPLTFLLLLLQLADGSFPEEPSPLSYVPVEVVRRYPVFLGRAHRSAQRQELHIQTVLQVNRTLYIGARDDLYRVELDNMAGDEMFYSKMEVSLHRGTDFLAIGAVIWSSLETARPPHSQTRFQMVQRYLETRRIKMSPEPDTLTDNQKATMADLGFSARSLRNSDHALKARLNCSVPRLRDFYFNLLHATSEIIHMQGRRHPRVSSPQRQTASPALRCVFDMQQLAHVFEGRFKE
ncbi:semaphorin-6B-like protein [Lates japonicus]|uniref:Semaphorin-6B-like protein n=1 Tax=Lates japonicus TaxID=270547 RepID=A0AAD3RI87_LATJO|nr:semaphorin-6B-like protein [Lates japonicus]